MAKPRIFSRHVELRHKGLTDQIVEAVLETTRHVRFKNEIDDAKAYVVMVGPRATAGLKWFDAYTIPTSETLLLDREDADIVLICCRDEVEARIPIFGTNHLEGSFWMVTFEKLHKDD